MFTNESVYESINEQIDEFWPYATESDPQTVLCVCCEEEILDDACVSINGKTLCLDCLGSSSLDEICELTGLQLEEIAACIGE